MSKERAVGLRSEQTGLAKTKLRALHAAYGAESLTLVNIPPVQLECEILAKLLDIYLYPTVAFSLACNGIIAKHDKSGEVVMMFGEFICFGDAVNGN